MTDKLLPCPFCCGDAEFERMGDRSQSTIVACISCGARLENGEEWDHGRGWNTRQFSPATIAAAVIAEMVSQPPAEKPLVPAPANPSGKAELEEIISRVEMYDVKEGDPRRRYTFAQIDMAVRIASDPLQSRIQGLEEALADMLPPDLPWKRDADGVLIHHKVSAINAARAALNKDEKHG